MLCVTFQRFGVITRFWRLCGGTSFDSNIVIYCHIHHCNALKGFKQQKHKSLYRATLAKSTFGYEWLLDYTICAGYSYIHTSTWCGFGQLFQNLTSLKWQKSLKYLWVSSWFFPTVLPGLWLQPSHCWAKKDKRSFWNNTARKNSSTFGLNRP